MNAIVICLIAGTYVASGATIYVLGRKIKRLATATQALTLAVEQIKKNQDNLNDDVRKIGDDAGIKVKKAVYELAFIGVKSK